MKFDMNIAKNFGKKVKNLPKNVKEEINFTGELIKDTRKIYDKYLNRSNWMIGVFKAMQNTKNLVINL